MLVSPAYAQAAGAPGGSELMGFLPLILIFVVFYFLLIRPQQKRMKQHKEMLGSIRRGDRIVTNGGIVGQVVRAGDDELTVEIAENVRVKVMRDMVANVVAKTEPVKGGNKEEDKAESEEAPKEADTQAGKGAGLKSLLSGKDKK